MFQVGQKVRHRASGEIGVIVGKVISPLGSAEPVLWKISTRFDSEVTVLESLLESAETPTAWIGLPCQNIIRANIQGEIQEVTVIGRRGLGLICRTQNGVDLVLESHAVDREEFRRLMEASPVMGPG